MPDTPPWEGDGIGWSCPECGNRSIYGPLLRHHHAADCLLGMERGEAIVRGLTGRWLAARLGRSGPIVSDVEFDTVTGRPFADDLGATC